MAQQVWKWWIILKDNFFFNDLLTKSNRTEIQTYKAEERTNYRKFVIDVHTQLCYTIRQFTDEITFNT